MKIEKNNQKRITKIIQETHHRFLNLFCMDVRHRNGEASEYYVASRAKSVTDLKAVTHRNEPDGVSIYSVYGEQKDRVVLVRQYLLMKLSHSSIRFGGAWGSNDGCCCERVS